MEDSDEEESDIEEDDDSEDDEDIGSDDEEIDDEIVEKFILTLTEINMIPHSSRWPQAIASIRLASFILGSYSKWFK